MKFAVHFDGWIIVEAENKGLAEDQAVDLLSIHMSPRFDGIRGDWTVLDTTEDSDDLQDDPVFDDGVNN